MVFPTSTGHVGEDMVEGDHLLREAFRNALTGGLESGAALLRGDAPCVQIYQLRTGLAYHAFNVADGRQAISDIYVPGDVIGLEAIVAAGTPGVVKTAAPTKYWALETASLRRLMANPAVALRVAALLSESQQRARTLAARIARLDAPERVAAMLVDLYDRLRRRDMIRRLSFNLRLTQQQIGDHLGLSGVHVNRVLRWLAREHIAFVERQVVIINDLPRLRALGRGERIVSRTAGIDAPRLADSQAPVPPPADRPL